MAQQAQKENAYSPAARAYLIERDARADLERREEEVSLGLYGSESELGEDWVSERTTRQRAIAAFSETARELRKQEVEAEARLHAACDGHMQP
jgi:hypothetical protein